MILLINGSFGVGKSTVARLLRQRMAGSRLYDPEWAGSILMRRPAFVKLEGAGTDDFQDLALWRKSVVQGVRLFRVFARRSVIVPMAFSRRDYFDEIVGGLRRIDREVKIFCLRAPLPTIFERLEKRGVRLDNEKGEWLVRKTRECLEAHRDAHFGEPLETEKISAEEVAGEILKLVGADFSNENKEEFNNG